MWSWKRVERIKWSEIVINEQVPERIGEKRTFLNNILIIKSNLICHILRSENDGSERRKKKENIAPG